MAMPMRSQRAEFKKDILLAKLESVVVKLSDLDLPATIKAVYAFGGVLRDKPMIHDLDTLFLYTQTPHQKARWDTFRTNFTNVHFVPGGPSLMSQLYPLLAPYNARGVRLSKAVMSPDVSEELRSRAIEPKWAACFSWTEIFFNPHGVFLPSIQRVMHGMLLKGIRGISDIFVQYDEFMQGKSHYSQFNSVLIWSSDEPDIRANILRRPNTKKARLLGKELKRFLTIISQLRSEQQQLKARLSRASTKIQLDYDVLEKAHRYILVIPTESYQELLERCETARSEIRAYEEEIRVLRTIDRIIPAMVASEYPLENPVEEIVAFLTLTSQPKYEVSEIRIREILRTLGIPEHKVQTIKYKGQRTRYELIEPMWKRRGEFQ